MLPSLVLLIRGSTIFFLSAPTTTGIYTLSLHDALPIWPFGMKLARLEMKTGKAVMEKRRIREQSDRSEEHTSELQSRRDLVCRLLLEKKKRTMKWPSEPSTRLVSIL